MENRKRSIRKRRIYRIRAKVRGTHERPRICFNRSNAYIWAQVIDDTKGKTLVYTKEKGSNTDCAVKLAGELAKMMTKKKVVSAVFDRRGYRYHGVVKAFAETLRNGGIKI